MSNTVQSLGSGMNHPLLTHKTALSPLNLNAGRTTGASPWAPVVPHGDCQPLWNATPAPNTPTDTRLPGIPRGPDAQRAAHTLPPSASNAHSLVGALCTIRTFGQPLKALLVLVTTCHYRQPTVPLAPGAESHVLTVVQWVLALVELLVLGIKVGSVVGRRGSPVGPKVVKNDFFRSCSLISWGAQTSGLRLF